MTLDSFAARVAFTLLASSGVMAFGLQKMKQRVNPETPQIPFTQSVQAAEPEDALARLTTAERSELNAFWASVLKDGQKFLLFEKGTCVLVDGYSPDAIKDAVTALDMVARPDAHFHTEPLEDGSFLVSHGENVFSYIPAEHAASQKDLLELCARELLTAEEKQAAPATWNPSLDARLGLMARRFMNEDAAEPTVAQIFIPSTLGGKLSAK